MASNRPNRIVYVVPAVALGAVLLYFLYGAIDRLGLETQRAEVRVTRKQIADGSTTYNTNIVAGRAWSQATKNPDIHVIEFDLHGVATGGAVTPEMYATLEAGDVVRVEYQQTRLTKQILVTDVRR